MRLVQRGHQQDVPFHDDPVARVDARPGEDRQQKSDQGEHGRDQEELVTPASIRINEGHRERDQQKSLSADERVDTIVKDANFEPHLFSDEGKP